MKRLGAGAGSALVAMFVGCSDNTPAQIRLGVPPTIMSEGEYPLGALVVNKAGEVLADLHANVAVAPPDIGVITQSGALRCLKNGNATISASIATISREVEVKCRLVDAIAAPDSVRLVIPNDPIAPKLAALGANGKRLQDVDITLSTEDVSVAKVEGDRLRPISVGRTSGTARAGNRSATFPIEVVRKIQTTPLLLNDGERTNFTLTQGTYDIEVQVRSGGTSYGVTLSWVGGEDCAYEREAQHIRSRCHIDDTGSVIITNPTAFGMGPAADGFVNVYEVP